MVDEEYPPLVPEQELIAYASPNDRQLVLAPPGAGKTHIVIARIEYLISEELLDPYELAVLCFTRAAVGEIVQRVTRYIKDTGMHDDIRFVAIRTFDSFATRLLLTAQHDEEIDLSGKGYDERIEMAVKALKSTNDSVMHQISNYRHLVVDEIQDLVGIRAELVQALLRRIPGGFTLLGDPAQAIYDFAKTESSNRESLISWIQHQQWPTKLHIRELTINHRSKGATAELSQMARRHILSEEDDFDAEQALRALLNTVPQTGNARTANEGLHSSPYRQICILCRSNGELLQLASVLADQGLDYVIRPKADEYALPAWVGRVLGDYSRPRLTRGHFEERWHELVGKDELIEWERAWQWLKRVEGGEQPELRMRELRHRFAIGQRLPDEADAWLYSNGNSLSLSTIHASKGREFDHVILLEQSSRFTSNVNTDNKEEARVLYVAATRARELLTRLGRDGLGSQLWKERRSSGRARWLSRSPSGYLFMEIGLPGDIESSSHVSKYVHASEDAAKEFQTLLWEKVRPGTRLHIAREQRGKYTFFQAGLANDQGLDTRTFAQTSLSFLVDLTDLLKQVTGYGYHYPYYWDTVRVARVVTEVIPLYQENIHEPYSHSGFFLGIRPKGMVYVTDRSRAR